MYLHSLALCLTHPHWALSFCWVSEKEKLFKQVMFICKFKNLTYLVNHTYSFILHVFNYISFTFIYLITVKMLLTIDSMYGSVGVPVFGL